MEVPSSFFVTFLIPSTRLLKMLLYAFLLFAVGTGLSHGRSQHLFGYGDLCVGRSSGKFLLSHLALYARCTPTYVECINQRPNLKTCPNNLSFDPNVRDCVPQTANSLCHVNPCRLLADGDYPHPDGNCKYYMRCSDGWTTIVSCVENGHVWNRLEKKCAHFSVVPPPCGHYITPRPTPPTVRPTTPPVVLSSTQGIQTTPPFCVGRPSGNYLPPGQSCSKLYYQCHSFQLTRAECPNKLSYDPIKGACVKVRDNLQCKENPCYALDDGVYSHPSGDCGRYLRCDNGWAIFVECPSVGLVWNDAAKVCTDASLVPPPCGRYFSPRPTPASSTPGNPSTTTTNTGISCVQKSVGEYISDVNEVCSPVYYVCVGTRFAISQVCAPGTFFDPEEGICSYKAHIPVCGGVRPTTVVTTAPPPTTPGIPFECKKAGLFANSETPCDTRFIICDVALIARTLNCSTGTYFDEELGVCLLFNDVPACSKTPRPITTPSTTQATTPSIDFDCQGETGNLPDPAEECSERFIMCTTAGIAYYRFCAAGTFFDRELKVCLHFHEVPECVGTPRTLTPPPTTTVRTTTRGNPETVPPFRCPGREGNYPPINLPCPGFYWQCHSTGVRRIECPTGLSFDHTKNSCVRIENNPFCSTNPCAGRVDGLYPDPKGSCDSYMHCLNGWGVFIQCENQQYVWNDRVKQCSPRSLVSPPCGSFLTTPATQPPTRPTTPVVVFTCSGLSPGNYREPGTLCLPFFHQCHRQSLPQRVFCPGALRFDHLDNKCIDAIKCFKKFNLIQ